MGGLRAAHVLAAGFVCVGVLALLFPWQFVMRAAEIFKSPAANLPLIYGLGVAFVACGLAMASETGKATSTRTSLACVGVALLATLYFLILTLRLQTWWIDDAGITFAYSRSLAAGLGLVAQPGLPPEEAYSSSVWMLLLAGMARLGADIPLAAKYLGIGFSALTILISSWILTRETRSPLAVLICGIGIAVGPTVAWAASGQEHALQALILLAVVFVAYLRRHWRWPVALILSVFVLTRPEAPIIVIAVFLAAVYLTRRAGGRLINAADLAVALLPFLTFVALMLFRQAYFGDLLPNPYYAKSSGAGLLGVINPLGGGWTYLFAGLRDTALFVVVGLLFLIRGPERPDWTVLAWAVLVGHVVFVVWAKGDWMGQYRFLMPILPVALLLVASGAGAFGTLATRQLFAGAVVVVLVHTTVLQLGSFGARPTTPMANVTKVGHTFRALADQLGIDDPVLAHHDAGGIAYHRMIRLIDLGGLINRTIAKNMDDRAFLTRYLTEETQPDFVYGARNFAAASGFADTPAFQAAYVPLIFSNQPGMAADLVYIHRSHITPQPGLHAEYDAAGTLNAVHVEIETP